MYYYNTGRLQEGRKRKPAAVRSAFMQAEEIEREREMSGWNPYVGEEELPPENVPEPLRPENVPEPLPENMPESLRSENMPESLPKTEAGSEGSEISDQAEEPETAPYFTMPAYADVLEEQKETERDLRRMQSMYPDTVKQMLPYIEEECDKMEYEGSAMYDEHPDHTTVEQIAERILNQIKDQLPGKMLETIPGQSQGTEELLSMQYRGPGRRPDRNWADDLIRILLLQEMHHRRCRHRGCRRVVPY